MIRLSDPQPAYCSACHNQPGGRFVDFDAAHDGGQWELTHPNGATFFEGSEDLHICEACLKVAMDVLAYKPALAARQLAEIRRLTIAAEHWQDYAKTLEATLADRPEPAPRAMGRVAV